MEEVLVKIRQGICERSKDMVLDNVKSALETGVDPNRIVNEGLIPAMDVVGKEFGDGTIFVPEMLVSAMFMKAGLDLVKPHLAGGEASSIGTIVIGTVKGDLHDIGKNIVAMMLEGAGFKVIDLGVDLTVETLIEKVKEHKPHVLGLSALLTTTMPEMKKVIEELEKQGLRDKVKVIIGGAPVDEGFAKKIGADGYGKDAASAVTVAKQVMQAA